PPVMPVKITEGEEKEEREGKGEGEEQRRVTNEEVMEEEGEEISRYALDDLSVMVKEIIDEHRKEEARLIIDDSAMMEESMQDDSGIAAEWSPEKKREERGEETSGMVEDSLRVFSASEEPSTSKKASASESTASGTDYRYHRTCFVCGVSTASFVYSPKDPLRAGPFFDELEPTTDERAVAQKFYVGNGARVIVCRSYVYEDDEEWMSEEESATD
ncbi:hypothetical protein PENTCL1PPCAC_19852, partial [Pristionchus entomophagus]